MRAVHIIVHGTVQGVGFRKFTKRIALKNNIKGWVRNTQDNKVEIQAVGTKKKIETFITSVHRGSNRSRVTKVDVDEIKQVKHSQSFQIIKSR